MDEDKPTEITIADIDKSIEIEKARRQYLDKIIQCCTCEAHDFLSCMIYGIQCQECFRNRLPMFSSCPVRDAYFKVSNES